MNNPKIKRIQGSTGYSSQNRKDGLKGNHWGSVHQNSGMETVVGVFGTSNSKFQNTMKGGKKSSSLSKGHNLQNYFLYITLASRYSNHQTAIIKLQLSKK